MEPADWQRFDRPEFGVEFRYPGLTPEGHAVERAEERFNDHRGDGERVHLTSRDSKELYVEVVLFRELAPPDEYRLHRPYLEQRFGSSSVTDLAETSLHGSPVWTYGVRWDDGERSVLLLQVGRDTCRIIYEPRSALNDEVVDTVTLADRSHRLE